jgi:hypothetical protein
MSIKKCKKTSGVVVNETMARGHKKREKLYLYRYRLSPSDVIKINGIPYKYTGNGYIEGNTKWEK